MATLVTRTTDQPDGTTAKGSELTHAEVDANFINLNSDKVEVSGAIVFAAKAGEALAMGDVVYVSGVSGNEPVVSKADADDASKMPAFGLAEADASLNAAVNVVTFGTLYDLDTSGFTAGDTVYVSTTAGGLTATKPAGEASLIQNIGKVIRPHAAAGSIKVGGAGRSNDTPNLNNGNVFIGNASNQVETRALVEADISDLQTYLTAETNDLSSAVTWANVPDANITQSSVTQHQAALSITESQISDLGTYLTAESDTLDSVTGRGATTTNAVTVGNLTSTGIDDNATSTAITIDASENVGIGVSSMNHNLQLPQVAGTSLSFSNDVGFSLDSTTCAYYGLTYTQPTGKFNVVLSAFSDLLLATNGAERMRIDSGGNVGIGGTPETELTVFGTTNSLARLIGANTGISGIDLGDTDDSDVGRIRYHHSDNSLRFHVSAVERLRLESDGDLHADGDVIAYSTTVSDQRLKDDVETIETALDKVGNLRGVTYTWNAGSRAGQRDYGVIAQEVEQVIPEIVREKEMALIDGETYKTVDYEKLTAVLIEAVKELKAEVDALKAAQ